MKSALSMFVVWVVKIMISSRIQWRISNIDLRYVTSDEAS